MSNQLVYRDDDISRETDLKRFKEIHALFTKYNVLHTVALITKDFQKNAPLLKFLKQQDNIDVQVHCHEHYDIVNDPGRFHDDLPKAVEFITKHFKSPTVLYPPWNHSNPIIERIARINGLIVNNKKISLSQYLRGVKGDTINFHFWAPECDDLEAALIKYTTKE